MRFDVLSVILIFCFLSYVVMFCAASLFVLALTFSFSFFFFFFFNDTATTEIYTLSLHDALPISAAHGLCLFEPVGRVTQNMSKKACETNRKRSMSAGIAGNSGSI